jgi:FtsP/CotA-like multicopper oxidase with cupredoxin domain
MKTAAQVYAGLAGMIYIEDPALAGSTGLPNTYGVDDIPLIIQDKAFNEDGSLYHDNFGPNMMFGFRGDVALVNGAVSPKADIPAGLVRLRLLNASNARIFTLRFEDDREFHQIASDGGYLPAPRKMNSLVLAPAERVEIVVDFSSPGDVRLLSLPDANALDGGMMSGFMHRMMGRGRLVPDGMNENDEFEIMTFSPDTSRKTEHSVLPAVIAGAPDIDFGEPVRRRTFSLEMHAGGGMMGGMMGRGQGGMMGGMGINGVPMDMGTINETVKIGETELWEVTTSEMAHPFHIHGTSFKVASNNGAPVEYAATGLKDVFLVSDRAEFLVRFDKPADAGTPFMYHCHILEHEDAGMMGQFTVS